MQRTKPRRLLTKLLMVVAIPGLLLAMMAGVLETARAQSDLPERRLEIGGLDVSEFPDTGVNLIVTDRQSRPLRELGALRLRESGVPIADYELTLLTAGTNVFMVVDANSRIQEADDGSGQTRLQKVKDSILAYAGRFMDLAGRDHVTVIVPDGESGRVLAEDVTAPGELIEAVQPFDAGRLPQSAVMDLLEETLDRAAAMRDTGRFQAIVLYTDASGLNEARFEPLIERAQELQTPIFVLLLGGGATPNETMVATATALVRPTRGLVVPMPAASDSSEVFQVIADNGVQTQVRYRSNIQQSGSYSVTVSLEDLRAQTTLDLELAAPEVRLDVPASIERAGTQPDAPLEALQPAVQTVSAEITWPDGIERRLQGAALLANGSAQEAPFFGGEGLVQFDWRIAELDAGQYALSVVVTDTLGFTAESEEQTVTIAVARPEAAPSPMPTPTPEPLQALRSLLPPLPTRAAVEPFVAPVGGALALLVLVILVWSIRQGRGAGGDFGGCGDDVGEEESAAEAAMWGERALLEALVEGAGNGENETYPLASENVTIGSAQDDVHLCVADRSISSLHARIRRRSGEYWLYDEGSEQGTFLNHQRLGLAPKQLRDGDEVQLGRVRLRFRVVKERNEVAHVGREGESESDK